jgi:integrase
MRGLFMDTIDTKILQANERLKAANIKITIERNGGLLGLRGTFPCKNGVGTKQQRIALRITATLDGLKLAELEANSIRKKINLGVFKWEKYTTPILTTPQKNVGEWLEEFEEHYFSCRERKDSTETTWKTDYLFTFKRLAKQEFLTETLLKETILKTKPDSRSRKKFVTVLSALAKFAGLQIDFKDLQGRYGLSSLVPREIPDNEKIINQCIQIENPYWRWIYAMIATYGLRNHEVFRLDFHALRKGNHVLSVLEGKTGARQVWPLLPEWFEFFNLALVKIPPINLDRSNAALGRSVTTFFFRNRLCSAYSLRHAWAIRSLEIGLDIALAAQQMGHSHRVHSEIYHHWISEKIHQQAYEQILKKRGNTNTHKLF